MKTGFELVYSLYIYIYTQLFYGQNIVFKPNASGLNSEISFYTGCHTKAKKLSLLYYFIHS